MQKSKQQTAPRSSHRSAPGPTFRTYTGIKKALNTSAIVGTDWHKVPNQRDYSTLVSNPLVTRYIADCVVKAGILGQFQPRKQYNIAEMSP